MRFFWPQCTDSEGEEGKKVGWKYLKTLRNLKEVQRGGQRSSESPSKGLFYDPCCPQSLLEAAHGKYGLTANTGMVLRVWELGLMIKFSVVRGVQDTFSCPPQLLSSNSKYSSGFRN